MKDAAFAKPTGLRLVSFVTGVVAIILGCIYLGPNELIRRDLDPGQVSIVAWVESAVPVWAILFLATGVSLVFAVMARRWVIAAHIVAIFTWTFYGVALIMSAVLSEPPSPIVTGVISLGLAVIHWGLVEAHQDAGHGKAPHGR